MHRSGTACTYLAPAPAGRTASAHIL